MKKLKRTMCLLLTLFLFCGIFAIPVSAQQGKNPDMNALLQTFKDYLDAKNIEYHNEEELVAVHFITQSNGWTVFHGTPGYWSEQFTSDIIGDYVFVSQNGHTPYQIGLYAEKENRVLTLKEAEQKGEIDITQIAHTASAYINACLVGDTNKDTVVNLTDVLNVQKAVSKTIGLYDVQKQIYDINSDGILNIKDALDMQKRIAKL